MEKPIIEVNSIGKKYNIAHMRGGYIALRDVLSNIMRSPLTFFKSKTRQIAGLEKKEEFWALKDISFSVKRGEVIGVIGANGAGKSTLLKILSQITPPTQGSITIRGRVGSLLEVGTGFHPELSGRENIFLNGAILGMTRQEIASKFDKIVEFAGIEKFLDTPVKYYSSGMYVRLAFSVAAHMEPDILLVDEVLAVGDAEFQKKCLGKMDEITKKEGRTILFVSHNMGAIQQLCPKCLVLNNGHVDYFGETKAAVEKYLAASNVFFQRPIRDRKDRTGNGLIRFTDFRVESASGKSRLETGREFKVMINLENLTSRDLDNVAISFSIKEPSANNNLLVFWTETSNSNFKIAANSTATMECLVKYCPLVYGEYHVNLYCTVNGIVSDYLLDAAKISIDDTEYFSKGRRDHDSHPKYILDHLWLKK